MVLGGSRIPTRSCAAGHELRGFLLSQNLSSAAMIFRNTGASDQQRQNNTSRNRFGSRRYATSYHPKSNLPFQLDYILVRGSDMRKVSSAEFSSKSGLKNNADFLGTEGQLKTLAMCIQEKFKGEKNGMPPQMLVVLKRMQQAAAVSTMVGSHKSLSSKI